MGKSCEFQGGKLHQEAGPAIGGWDVWKLWAAIAGRDDVGTGWTEHLPLKCGSRV